MPWRGFSVLEKGGFAGLGSLLRLAFVDEAMTWVGALFELDDPSEERFPWVFRVNAHFAISAQ